MPARQGLQRGQGRAIDPAHQARAVEVLLRRARPIQRQPVQGRQRGQLLAPIIQLHAQAGALQAFSLGANGRSLGGDAAQIGSTDGEADNAAERRSRRPGAQANRLAFTKSACNSAVRCASRH